MDNKIISSFRMGKIIELTYDQAKELIKNTDGEYSFNNLNKSTVKDLDDNIGFEVVQNRRYYISKVGRKGSLLYKGSEFETKTELGIFQLKMTWDFKHPKNFSENKYNCFCYFEIAI